MLHERLLILSRNYLDEPHTKALAHEMLPSDIFYILALLSAVAKQHAPITWLLCYVLSERNFVFVRMFGRVLHC